MAEVVRYVDPDATGAADGTSWTDAYTSLQAWNIAEATDLVSDGDTHVVNCRASSGTADTTRLVMSASWTTGASNGITIQVALGDRQTPTQTGYRIDTTSEAMENTNVGYITFDGLAVSTSSGVGFFNTQTNCNFTDCWAFDCSQYGFYQIGANAVYINCVSSNCSRGFWVATSCIAYNCDALNAGDYGFYVNANDTLTATNCYADGATAGYFVEVDGIFTDTTCASSDGSESTTTIAMSTSTGAYFVNVSAGSEDWRISSASSDLIGAGTDLSGTFTTDMFGTTRSAWDIGAAEFVSGGVTHQLAGSVDSQSALTGLLNLTQRLSASLNSSSHTSGVLRLIQRLIGSLNSSSAVSGTIRLIHGLSGALQSVSSVVGNIRLIQRLRGAINSISALVGNIRLKIGLSGSTESHSQLTGNLRIPGVQSLSGSIQSHSLLSGTLTEEGIVETLFFNIDRTETLNFDIDTTTEIDYNIDRTEEIDFDIDTE